MKLQTTLGVTICPIGVFYRNKETKLVESGVFITRPGKPKARFKIIPIQDIDGGLIALDAKWASLTANSKQFVKDVESAKETCEIVDVAPAPGKKEENKK